MGVAPCIRWWPWLVVLGVCTGIFLLSADPNSARHSQAVVDWLLSWAGQAGTAFAAAHLEFFRKGAHTAVYATLGGASQNAFRQHRRGWLWALLFCCVYAASDELHQALVPGRGAEFSDVVLDTTAAALGIGLARWALRRRAGKRPAAVADPIATEVLHSKP